MKQSLGGHRKKCKEYRKVIEDEKKKAEHDKKEKSKQIKGKQGENENPQRFVIGTPRKALEELNGRMPAKSVRGLQLLHGRRRAQIGLMGQQQISRTCIAD